MYIMLILNLLIFFKKKVQSVEYGLFICISGNKKRSLTGDEVT
jgi:hypothetical protein